MIETKRAAHEALAFVWVKTVRETMTFVEPKRVWTGERTNSEHGAAVCITEIVTREVASCTLLNTTIPPLDNAVLLRKPKEAFVTLLDDT